MQTNTCLQPRALDLPVKQITLGVTEQRVGSDCGYKRDGATTSQR